MIKVEVFQNSVDVLIIGDDYASIRIKRLKTLMPEFKRGCKIFQDANGSLIIEYNGKRVVDEREMHDYR